MIAWALIYVKYIQKSKSTEFKKKTLILVALFIAQQTFHICCKISYLCKLMYCELSMEKTTASKEPKPSVQHPLRNTTASNHESELGKGSYSSSAFRLDCTPCQSFNCNLERDLGVDNLAKLHSQSMWNDVCSLF